MSVTARLWASSPFWTGTSCVAASPSLLPAPQCHSGMLRLVFPLQPPQTRWNSQQAWCAVHHRVCVRLACFQSLSVRVVPLAKDLMDLRCSCPTCPPQAPLVLTVGSAQSRGVCSLKHSQGWQELFCQTGCGHVQGEGESQQPGLNHRVREYPG